MTKDEKRILTGLVDDIRNSDDEIDPLVRLYEVVKTMIKYGNKYGR